MSTDDQNSSVKNANHQSGQALKANGIERIVPPFPTIKADEVESLIEWGFEDSGFKLNERGHATFTGKRWS